MDNIFKDKHIPILGNKPPDAWIFVDNEIGIQPMKAPICLICMTRAIIISMEMLSVELLYDDENPDSGGYNIICGCEHCGALQTFIVHDSDKNHFVKVIQIRKDKSISKMYVLPRRDSPDFWGMTEIQKGGK